MATLLDGVPCVDPATFRDQCLANGLPPDPWWGKANAFEVPVGRDPGRGWVLLTGGALGDLGTTSDHTLTFLDSAGNSAGLAPVTILRAQCVGPSYDGDPLAVYLCEVADRRFHLARVPTDSAYNVTSADGSGYLAATYKTGTTPWTWQQVVDDLVTALGLDTADFVLPFTPDGTPENFTFWGGRAWDALCDVLDRLACAVKYDPQDDSFAVVRLGEADAAADALAGSLDDARVWDAYPLDPARAWRPEKVQVQFLRRPRPADGSSPYYSVDVALAAAAGVVAGTYVQLKDDAAALGATGTPSNSAALATRAAERAADWLRKRSGYERRLLRVYRDFLPDVPATAAGSTAGRAGFDDRGGPMTTSLAATPDGLVEAWRPLSDLPPWVPQEYVVPVETTGVYDAATGYPWKRLDLDPATPGFVYASPVATGDMLFEVAGDEDVASGTRLLMWPDPDGDGWECQAPATPLTVRDVAGTSVVSGVTTLEFDQADGFQVTAVVAGTARVDLLTQMSVTADAGGLKLVNDQATPGNSYYYGTDSGGTKGWYVLPSGYTDEQAQDAIAAAWVDTWTADYTYDDAANTMWIDVRYQMSVTADAGGLKFVNDQASPGAGEFYGTNSSGAKGWYPRVFGSAGKSSANPPVVWSSSTKQLLTLDAGVVDGTYYLVAVVSGGVATYKWM